MSNYRSNIISVLAEQGCSSQTLTEQSRCRERAACALILRRCGNTNNQGDGDCLKFVQEVARFVRFVASRFLGKKFLATGMELFEGVCVLCKLRTLRIGSGGTEYTL